MIVNYDCERDCESNCERVMNCDFAERDFLLVQKVILQKNGFLPNVIFFAKAIMRIVLSVIREPKFCYN